jgi:hypothetical protein
MLTAIYNGTEEIILSDESERTLFHKLNNVESGLSEVRTSLGSLAAVLNHMGGDFNKLEGILESLEKLLYGKGEMATLGIMSRIMQLERQEARREKLTWICLTAIVGLIIEFIWRIILTNGLK